MKTPFHTRLICCGLAVLVLLSSTGFGLVEHWCQMRGHSKVLLLADNGCVKPCTKNDSSAASHEPIVEKLPCCKTKLSYEHLDVSRFIADQPTPAAPQLAEFIPDPQFQLLLVALLPADADTSAPRFTDDPLFRPGRFRLISFCTWLI